MLIPEQTKYIQLTNSIGHLLRKLSLSIKAPIGRFQAIEKNTAYGFIFSYQLYGLNVPELLFCLKEISELSELFIKYNKIEFDETGWVIEFTVQYEDEERQILNENTNN